MQSQSFPKAVELGRGQGRSTKNDQKNTNKNQKTPTKNQKNTRKPKKQKVPSQGQLTVNANREAKLEALYCWVK